MIFKGIFSFLCDQFLLFETHPQYINNLIFHRILLKKAWTQEKSPLFLFKEQIYVLPPLTFGLILFLFPIKLNIFFLIATPLLSLSVCKIL